MILQRHKHIHQHKVIGEEGRFIIVEEAEVVLVLLEMTVVFFSIIYFHKQGLYIIIGEVKEE